MWSCIVGYPRQETNQGCRDGNLASNLLDQPHSLDTWIIHILLGSSLCISLIHRDLEDLTNTVMFCRLHSRIKCLLFISRHLAIYLVCIYKLAYHLDRHHSPCWLHMQHKFPHDQTGDNSKPNDYMIIKVL